MNEQNVLNTKGAQLDFICMESGCGGLVRFNLMELDKNDFQVMCPKCHRPYEFDKALQEQFLKLRQLILAVRDAEPILGDCNVGVAVPGGEVKIPYSLLLTRMNTMITLSIGDQKVDFHLWVEPSSSDTFR